MRRLAILALCLAACAPAPGASPDPALAIFAQATPYCQLMADPMSHVGQPVLVSGLYVASPHGGRIYGAECKEDNGIELHGELGLENDKRAQAIWASALRRDDSSRPAVVYRGVFAARHFIETCSDVGCWRFSIERAQLVAARKPQAGR